MCSKCLPSFVLQFPLLRLAQPCQTPIYEYHFQVMLISSMHLSRPIFQRWHRISGNCYSYEDPLSYQMKRKWKHHDYLLLADKLSGQK